MKSSEFSRPMDLETFFRILFSTEVEGYSCSRVIAKRSRNAELRTLVPIKRPSSDPLPLVFAVAITLNPEDEITFLLIFFRNTPFPSRIDCRHMILLDARSISSRRRIAPFSIASTTGPLCQTVSPSRRRNPPSKSSVSVSAVIFTRISSRFS